MTALDLLRLFFDLLGFAAFIFAIGFIGLCASAVHRGLRADATERRARRAIESYALTLVPRDEVADRRERRHGGDVA